MRRDEQLLAALEAEGRRPGGIAAVPGLHPAYTPITEEQAARNWATLAAALGEDPAPLEEPEGTE